MRDKKILIIDEAGFCRVCSAILEFEGFKAQTVTDVASLPSELRKNHIQLVILSYPYGASLFDEIRRKDIPTIVLSDHLSSDLIDTLDGMSNTYCMIKPLDYQKFRHVVKEVMMNHVAVQGGYNIV